MKNVNNSQTAKFRLALLIKVVLMKKACIAKVGKFPSAFKEGEVLTSMLN